MKSKVLFLELLVCVLLLASTLTVCAIDEYEEYTDEEDDVIDMLSESTVSRPNVDILNVVYSRTGKNVKITLTVKGNIQNAGDINDFENFPMVYYNILLATDSNEYDIIYINKVVNMTNNAEDIAYEIDGSDLELTFTLDSANEVYEEMIILTAEFSSLTEFYADEFTSEIIGTLDVDAGGPHNGKPGETIEFSGKVIGGTGPYEWEWDLDGDYEIDSTEQNPTWTYDAEGEYDVTLTVIDSLGDQGIDFTTVTISTSGNGNNDSGGTPLILFVALIVIIVIAGIVVLVYVIRR